MNASKFFVRIVVTVLVAVLLLPGIAGAQEEPAEPVNLYEEVIASYGRWVFISVSENGRAIRYNIQGESWELPLESWMATDLSGDRYGTKEPLQSSPEVGYCEEGMRDCTSHLFLWRTAVPEEYLECFESKLEIAHRVLDTHECDEPIPVLVGLRFNLAEVTGDEAWGLSAAEVVEEYNKIFESQQPGLFIAAGLPHYSPTKLILPGASEAIPVGYSCWDCLADTSGPAGDVVQLNPGALSFTGDPETAPLGESEYPGVVIPIRQDWEWQFTAIMMLPERGAEDIDYTAVRWLGEYNEYLFNQTPTPTPTLPPTLATATPEPPKKLQNTQTGGN